MREMLTELLIFLNIFRTTKQRDRCVQSRYFQVTSPLPIIRRKLCCICKSALALIVAFTIASDEFLVSQVAFKILRMSFVTFQKLLTR